MINGILNVYKEKGFTSHDVVAKLRGIVGQRKIGHTGTLDPDAEGVLPVCLGKATKLVDMLIEKDKVYQAALLLGKTSDTQDSSGVILRSYTGILPKEQDIRNVVKSFCGDYEQIPPMYSAIKINGKKLYALARAGQEVVRKPRKVHIQRITILKIDLPRVFLEVECAKGTYIRTLCHDIGAELNCGGLMESLLRTKVGFFNIDKSLRLSQVEELVAHGRLSEVLYPIDAVFSFLQKVRVRPEKAFAAYNGNVVLLEYLEGIERLHVQEGEKIRLYDRQDVLIGIFRFTKDRTFVVDKMFLDREEINGIYKRD
ncbi:MAG: tRNA pseudouridine(55) synthase TruB [Lachnospiraceae bacterium]|nr:tRNA pseudouridine(55) synthase TruB [Lachnospiraceae bacterium]